MVEKMISREQLLSDLEAALCATKDCALIVTRDDEPTSVILSIENYERLLRGDATLEEAFSHNVLSEEAAAYDLSGSQFTTESLAKAS